jgi:hypothetical protein
MEPRTLLSTFHWAHNADGNFNVPTNWLNQANQPGVPGPNDNATIVYSGIKVTVPASVAVNSLTSNASLAVTGGTLSLANVAASSSLAQLALSAGAKVESSGGKTSIGGGAVAGTLSVGTGATIDFFSGTTSLNAGTSFSGDGLVQIAGGTVDVMANLTGPQRLELDSGTLSLAAGSDFTLAGNSTWDGGTIAGTGTVTNPSGSTLTLSGSASKELAGATLVNAGTIAFSGAGPWAVDSAATLNNSGRLDFQGDEQITTFGAHTLGTINNTGMILKSAGTGIGALGNDTFNNSAGTIEVDSGQLTLSGGTETGGKFTVAAGSVLDLTGAQAATLSGTYTGSGGGVVQISGGTVTVGSGGATWNFPAGQLHWTGGWITGLSGSSLTIARGSMLTLSGPAGKILNTPSVVNNGTIADSGAGTWSIDDGMTLANAGLIDLQGNEPIVPYGVHPVGTIANTGTVQKSAGTGSSSVDVIFDSSGTVAVQQGTLSLSGDITQVRAGGVLTGGTWVIAGMATLTFPNGGTITTNQASVTLGGAGSAFSNLSGLTTNAGVLALAGGANFRSSAALSNSGSLIIGPASTLTVAAGYTQAPTGTLDLKLGGAPATSQFGQLIVNGRASLAGTLMADLVSGYNPRLADSFTVASYTSHTGNFTSLQLPSASGFTLQAAVNGSNVILSTTTTSTPKPTPTPV